MITTYGERNSQAPDELELFSFLVGKWNGEGVTWIGRYILNGMAIADEGHSLGPDGKPYFGISFRQFDAERDAWIIEYLNVSASFIRRQVNPQSGSVRVDAGTVVVLCEDGQTRIREHYRATDRDHFTYIMDLSRDEGLTWDAALIEMTMTRVE